MTGTAGCAERPASVVPRDGEVPAPAMGSSVGPTASAGLRGDESGSTLILTIFYCCLALVLVLLVTAASSLYLERKRLFSLADGAALAGASAFGLDDLASTATGAAVSLDPTAVSTEVHAFVAEAPHRFDGLQVEHVGTPGGSSVVVELSSQWSPPVVGLLVPDGLRVTVQASARPLIG